MTYLTSDKLDFPKKLVLAAAVIAVSGVIATSTGGEIQQITSGNFSDTFDFVTSQAPDSPGVQTQETSQVNLQKGLESYYRFDDPGASKGYSLKLDGNDDYITADSVTSEIAAGDFAVSYWLKTTTQSNLHTLTFNTQSGGNDILLGVNNGFANSYDGSHHIGSINVSDGRWHQHVLVLDNSTGEVVQYVDGKKDLSYNTNKFIPATDRFSIGQEWDGDTPSQFFPGSIDDVRVYTKKLTLSEVKNLYNQGAWRTSSTSEPEDSSKVLDLPFQYQDASTVFDTSRYENHASKNNGASQLKANRCKVGRCYSFDGEDDYFEVSNSPSLDISDKFTWMAWVKLDSKANDNTIFGKQGAYELTIQDDNMKIVSWGDDWKPAYNFPTGKWTHISVTGNGSERKLYMDGELVASGGPDYNIDSSGSPIQIGDWPDLDGNGIDGKIDELKIINKSLSQGEIIQRSQEVHGKPVLDMTFDSVQDGVVYDSSSGDNHGTFRPNESAGPAQVNGINGEGLDFDGADDSVFINTDSDINDVIGNGSSFTIYTWLKPENLDSRDYIANQRHRLIRIESDGTIQARLWDEGGTSHSYSSGVQIPQDRFSQVAIGVNRNSIKFFIDGDKVKEISKNWLLNKNSRNLAISGANWNTDYRNFDGIIDNFKIFSYNLPESKISQMYRRSKYSNPEVNLEEGLNLFQSFDRVETCGQQDTIECPSGVNGKISVDESGERNHGELVNGPTELDDCKLGDCLSFDGDDDYVATQYSEQFNRTTVSVWVNLSGTPSGPTGGVLGRYHDAGNKEDLGLEYDKSSEEWRWAVQQQDDTWSSATAPATKGEWVHLVGVADPDAGDIRLFVNGEKVGVGSYSGDLMDTDANLSIGTVFYDSTTKWSFPGNIDQIKLYGNVLSESEVKELYEKGKDQLVLHQNFNGGPENCDLTSGNSCLTDKSGNNNAGTPHGFEDNTFGIGSGWSEKTPLNRPSAKDSSGNTHPALSYGGSNGKLKNFDFDSSSGWVNGESGGSALKFDGKDDFVSIEHRERIDLQDSDFSICLWARSVEDRKHTLVAKNGGGFYEKGFQISRAGSPQEVYMVITDKEGTSIKENLGVPGKYPWTHFCMVRSGNTLEGYVNGTLDGTDTDNTLTDTSNIDPLWVGKGYDRMNGSIDDVRLYKRNLSASEVKSLYNGEPVNKGLVGRWNFEAGNRNTAYDTSSLTETGILGTNGVGFSGGQGYLESKGYDSENVSFSFWTRVDESSWSRKGLFGTYPSGLDSGGLSAWSAAQGELWSRIHGAVEGESSDFSGDLSLGNEWSHVAYIFNEDNGVGKKYVDGEFSGKVKFKGNIEDWSILRIARQNGKTWNGAIDEFRVYNRTLSKKEVQKLAFQ